MRVYLPPWAGIAVLILIFCEHSVQNNVQGSTRTARSGIQWCIDMINSLPSEKTTQVIRLGPMAESRTAERGVGDDTPRYGQ